MKNSDRIVGGEFAPANIPWQAQVHMGENSHYADQLGPTHFCGATILDAKTVLSAAHCFFADKSFIQKWKVPEKYHGKKFINAILYSKFSETFFPAAKWLFEAKRVEPPVLG